MNILVSQIDMKNSQAIIRHLAKRGYKIYGLKKPGEMGLLTSRYLSGVFELEQAKEDEFIAGLLSVLGNNKMDVFIPVGHPVTLYSAKHAASIQQKVKAWLPTLKAIEQAENKFETMQVAEAAGISSPKTYRVTWPLNYEAITVALSFPIVIKYGFETGGKNVVQYADNIQQLESVLSTASDDDIKEQRILLQEYITGFGCGYFAFVQNGKIKREFMHRRVREYPVSGGPSSCAESYYDDDFKALGRKLILASKMEGPVMAEFKYDEARRKYQLIEINPKFWGSLELALTAGADFAGDYVKASLGEDLIYNGDYKQVRFQWPLQGDFQHAFAKTSDMGAVLKDFFSFNTKKNLYWDDPMITLRYFLVFVKKLVLR